MLHGHRVLRSAIKPGGVLYAGVQDDGKLVGLALREQEVSAAVLAGMAAEVGATSQLLQQLPVGQHRAALYVRVRRASVDHLICTDLCVAGRTPSSLFPSLRCIALPLAVGDFDVSF